MGSGSGLIYLQSSRVTECLKYFPKQPYSFWLLILSYDSLDAVVTSPISYPRRFNESNPSMVPGSKTLTA